LLTRVDVFQVFRLPALFARRRAAQRLLRRGAKSKHFRQPVTEAAVGRRPILQAMMGEELRKLRERAELTQEQLSFKSGLSRPYISQLERNLKSPTVDTPIRIWNVLEVSAVNVIKRVDGACEESCVRNAGWL
jgi:DNA-binding XRE family transcriptional regulator